MSEFRTEADSLGQVEVPATKLWGAQTQRSLQHFSIGQDLIPREMIAVYAIVKRAPRLLTTSGGGSMIKLTGRSAKMVRRWVAKSGRSRREATTQPKPRNWSEYHE